MKRSVRVDQRLACAHPLDDGTAIMLEPSIEATAGTLDACDRGSYRSLVTPLASRFAELSEDILWPIRHIPRHPLRLARFASSAFLPAASLARSHFAGKRGGSMDIRQVLFRPTHSLYRTPGANLYLCGAITPPGGGVHGMAGYHAATTAIKDWIR